MLKLRCGCCSALTFSNYQKLIQVKVHTVIQFLAYDLDQLLLKSGVPFRDLLAIKRFLLAQHSAVLTNALEVYKNIRSTTCILPTGCAGLDKVLEGGLYSGEVTGLSGSSSSGKTQICFSTVCAVASDLQKNVVFFDTGGQFDSARLVQMMDKYELSVADRLAALKRIKVIQVLDIFELFSELDELKNSLDGGMDGFYKSLKLVVLDSLTTLTATISSVADSTCNGLLDQLTRTIKVLTGEFSVGFLITSNSVSAEHAHKAGNHPDKLLTRVSNTQLETEYECKLSTLLCPSFTSDTSFQLKLKLLKSCRQAIGSSVNIVIKESGLETVV